MQRRLKCSLVLVAACTILSGCNRQYLHIEPTDEKTHRGKAIFEGGAAIRTDKQWFAFATFYDEGSRFVIDDEGQFTLLFTQSLGDEENNESLRRVFFVVRGVWSSGEGYAFVSKESWDPSDSTLSLQCDFQDGHMQWYEKFTCPFDGTLDRITLPIVPKLSSKHIYILEQTALGELLYWAGALAVYKQERRIAAEM